MTGQEMNEDDLMALKTGDPVKPRHAPSMGIPGMLVMFHKEWDANMLECFELRKELADARQQLATALYQHDAACRVIARLMREKEAAQKSLEDMHAQVQRVRAAEVERRPGAEDEPENKRPRRDRGVPEEVVEAMDAKSKEMFEMRSHRDANPAGHADREALAAIAPALLQPLHSTTAPGILCMALPGVDERKHILTGGADHTVQVLNVEEETVTASLKGHGKKVTTVAFAASSTFVSGSADRTVKHWSAAGEGGSSFSGKTVASFDAAVVAVTIHPLTKLAVAAASNASAALLDLEAGEEYWRYSGDEQAAEYLCAAMHPDGKFYATGSADGKLRIHDAKSAKLLTEISAGLEGPVPAMAFNENGYWVALSSDSGVSVVDLRKQKQVLTFKPFEDAVATCLSWDQSGKFLACGGGPAVKLYEVTGKKKKTAEVIKSILDLPKKGVHCVGWGPAAKTLYVGAADHNLRSYTC